VKNLTYVSHPPAPRLTASHSSAAHVTFLVFTYKLTVLNATFFVSLKSVVYVEFILRKGPVTRVKNY